MSIHTTRPAAALQAADCRHSREPFDAGFRIVNCRRDISPAAKLVHGYLVTLLRTGRGENQTEIGEALGLSRHQVWRATGELVAAGLVVVTRRGLGRPNGYELCGVPADDLAGRATGRPAVRQAVAGQSGHRARVYPAGKKPPKNGSPPGRCDLCGAPRGTPHGQAACYRRGLPSAPGRSATG